MLCAPLRQSSHMEPCTAAGTDTWHELSQSLYINFWSDNSTRRRTITALVITPKSDPALLFLLLPWFLHNLSHCTIYRYCHIACCCGTKHVNGSTSTPELPTSWSQQFTWTLTGEELNNVVDDIHMTLLQFK